MDESAGRPRNGDLAAEIWMVNCGFFRSLEIWQVILKAPPKTVAM